MDLLTRAADAMPCMSRHPCTAGNLLLQYDCVTFLSYLEVLKEGEVSHIAPALPEHL